ncbi:hypothetical protein [Nocardioides sp.]|uniref:hypothetical protein n=1 Tax=Nocardioides sp. TaxID=35761 RepID=UPI002B2757CA|nr:hypothetical protein [Nocardioides sp.]
MFFATGAQPAEALPDSTVAYLSVDLDPSGQQKLEALSTLRQFPAFVENVDLRAEDDLRLRLFEQLQGDGLCPEVDFEDDIDPWLGNRFATAAIKLGGAGEGTAGLDVTAVGVVQLDDAERAEDGLAALRACGGDSEAFGWSIVGDWAVLAETEQVARDVTDAAADAPLSADDDFERWTGEAGDPGILTGYAAPAFGGLFADIAGDLGGLGGFASPPIDCLAPRGDDLDPFAEDPFAEDPFGSDPFGSDPFADECSGEFVPPAGDGMNDMFAAFADFEGAAMTMRFSDGGLEVEVASGVGKMSSDSLTSDAGADVVSTLPEDTAVALGIGLPEGWSEDFREGFDDVLGEGGLDGFLSLAEAETGLDLPQDLETLLGTSTAVALGGDADLADLDAPEPPADFPLGLKVQGDTEAISEVFDDVLRSLGDPTLDSLLGYDVDGDFMVAGPSADYRAELLGDGGLGDTDVFEEHVLGADEAAAVFFVNFDAGSWLTSIPGLPDDVRRNLAPLNALGFSGWTDDDVSHVALRLSTD